MLTQGRTNTILIQIRGCSTSQRRILQPAIAAKCRSRILQVPKPRNAITALGPSIPLRLLVKAAACFQAVVQRVHDDAHEVGDDAAAIGLETTREINTAGNGKRLVQAGFVCLVIEVWAAVVERINSIKCGDGIIGEELRCCGRSRCRCARARGVYCAAWYTRAVRTAPGSLEQLLQP